VQLADAPLIDMDLLYWSRHYRNMPGQGDLPVTDFMRAVAATGYAGPLSLEVFNDQFRGGSPKSVAVDGKRSLVNLMDHVAASGTGQSVPVPPAMPDRIAVDGVEFIEFAADENEGQELAALLRTMGFAERGRHRNRDVTLFRQGGINIVINTERKASPIPPTWFTARPPMPWA
jgi:4-hydroxyphenylpyruvate dioxygenase